MFKHLEHTEIILRVKGYMYIVHYRYTAVCKA